jgi:hypothetical protein
MSPSRELFADRQTNPARPQLLLWKRGKRTAEREKGMSFSYSQPGHDIGTGKISARCHVSVSWGQERARSSAAPFPDSGQRPTFPRWLQDRKAPVEAEEEHRGPVRRGCARCLHAGFRHRKGQQEISTKRRMGIRAVQLRSRIRHIHGRSQPLRLRILLPCGGEGEGLHLPPIPEALNGCPRRPGPSAGFLRR